MFFVFHNTKYRKLKNFEEARALHEAGKIVVVSGWVKATVEDFCGGQKTIKFNDDCQFNEILSRTRLYKIIKVETQRKKSYTKPTPKSTYNYKKDRYSEKLVNAREMNKVLNKFDSGLDLDVIKMDSLPPKKRKKLEKIGKIPKSKKGKNSGGIKSRSTSVDFDRETCKEKMIYMWSAFEKLKAEWELLGQDTNIITLFHGTDMKNVESILTSGFRLPMHSGMLGCGIYAGNIEKARSYGGFNSIILKVEVMLGNCKEIDDQEFINASKNSMYDSLYLKSGQYGWAWGGRIRHDEWIVRRSSQIRVIGIIMSNV